MYMNKTLSGCLQELNNKGKVEMGVATAFG